MSEKRATRGSGDPNVSVLLTWLVPGAGHLYLGRTVTGILAFVLVEGLYLLGWWLSDGRTFEFLDPELQGPFATVLTPEAGNLGAMLLHLRHSGFGSLGEALPLPAWIVAGSFLSALSGIANLFLATHAHFVARSAGVAPHASPHPVLALVGTWCLPGLGHWLQGRRRRAVIVFCVLMGLFVAGTWLSAGTNLSRERHFYYWSGQFLLGGPALLLEAVSGHPRVTRELPWADVGLLYACMAGLLNVLAMLDVFGVAEKRWFGWSEPPRNGGAQEAQAEGEASA